MKEESISALIVLFGFFLLVFGLAFLTLIELPVLSLWSQKVDVSLGIVFLLLTIFGGLTYRYLHFLED